MLLKNLISNIPIKKKNIFIRGISIDSKEIKKNFIFFAIKGNKINGEKFIKKAIIKGAKVIVCSKNCKIKIKNNDVILLKTNKIRELLSLVASRFYNFKPKNIIAVTGTNGKTSVADIFHQILSLNKIPSASIGTLGVKYNYSTIKTTLTSPDTISLHKYLNFLKKKKIDNVIIEASSHGLDQKRLHNINFKAGVFTNFSHDHLDYHKNMNNYLKAKLILFKELLKINSTIISDEKISPFKIIKKIALKRNLKIFKINKELNKLKSLSSKLKVDFKVKNLAMAIEAAKLCGLKKNLAYASINKLEDVDGRFELAKRFPQNIQVFIDYAHTPDALLKTLKSLKISHGKNISIVFGCGGDRDKQKRPLMAQIANRHCQKIYITDDNPRNENPTKIRNQLSKYINNNKLFNIGKRDTAIKKAIQNAKPNEIILIAGKGHEKKQIYKNRILNISDKEIVNKIRIKEKKVLDQRYLQNNFILKRIFKKIKPFKFNGLKVDSRLVKKNNLFLALKGKNNNGSNFINEALKKGAACIISNSNINLKKKKIIKTKNPILFLNQFAELKRKYTSAKIIAITGSAGKTSLKNLIKNILQNFGKTHYSPKSFNNHFGVPISLSNLNPDDKFGVFEVGMSKPNELRKLTKLIKPHLGIITNIGDAHIENFKNIKGIANAKSEIIENILPGGSVILNRDDKFFKYLFNKAKINGLKIYTFGMHKGSDICAKKILKKGSNSRILVNIGNKNIDLDIGDQNIHNVLASLAVLKELEIDPTKIVKKYKNIDLTDGRGKKHNILRYNKKFRLIDESYNANPQSVKNAINKFNLIKKNNFKKYLLLGDMLELGPKSEKYHRELSKVINNSDIDKVFIKGKKTIFTYKYLKKNKRGNIFQNEEDIDICLDKVMSNNDFLMIKGSNATGLNNFANKIIKGT